MHIHILGICGTFMGSLAVLARQLGHEVSGSDENVYPPMSTQLEEQGIELSEGYDPAHLKPAPDMVVIGNTCSRGNPAVEYVLRENLPFCSGPEWLSQHVLKDHWVLAVAGTHGKTTTTTMLAWILYANGYAPGFLIGGVPKNFSYSADIGASDFFVIEADEYDSAFFDKRSKFIHYRPRTTILGNLEFDHADIFRDLEDIQRQFQHLVKIIPGEGCVITPNDCPALDEVLKRGLWCEHQTVGLQGSANWLATVNDESGTDFSVSCELGDRHEQASVSWCMTGMHNVRNALAALAAAHHVGISLESGARALCEFKGVKRRLELLGDFSGVHLYDDFAHHPTAIATTLAGLRAGIPEQGRVIAIIEARSNTMKMGYHQDTIAQAVKHADIVLWYRSPGTGLDLDAIAKQADCEFTVMDSTDAIVEAISSLARFGDHIVVMSNGGFEGIHARLQQALVNLE